MRYCKISAILLLSAALPAGAAWAEATTAPVAFRPVEMPAHAYVGGWEHFVGGGVAVFDCDGDGLPELYAAGGSAPAALMRNRSDGAVRFEAATPDALALTGVTGAYPLDIDGDGVLDLAILRAGENVLMQGKGDCGFEPMAMGFTSADRWTTAFSATWEPGATRPTLAFGNYVDRTDPDGPFRACDVHSFYRPDGDGYGAPVELAPGFCALSMLFTDWDRAGRADLRVSNDRHYHGDEGEEQMWAMEGAPRLYTAADGWRRHVLWGMGIASRDIDGDGRAEVMLSSMGDQRLQYRDGDGPAYADVAFEEGTTAHTPYAGADAGKPSTGWHVEFGDVQNDGRDDLFIAKGNVDSMEMAAMADLNNLLIAQSDGSFAEAGASAGVASPHRGRGAALADLDGDGRLDLVVVNRRAPLEVWQNVTENAGRWLAVDVAMSGSNTRAVGGFIEVDDGSRIHLREIIVGGGHAGGQAGRHHFGLGAAQTVRLRVIWPGGEPSPWQEVTTNATVRVDR
ncbi:MAG: CRTAC1 family protein [Pseudomonadota bacterium]